MNTQHDITTGGQTLDPPTPPRKPHRLLWIDLETTGISRTEAKILEIGMIVTSLDAAEEGDRFICPVHPDHVSLYDLDPYQGHTGTHRVEDCIRRDRNDYANYLDIMRAGHQGTQS